MMVKTVRKLSVPLLILALLLIAVQPALAQGNEPIAAGVDKMTLSTDETLMLTVVVNVTNQNVPPPELPSLDGFTIAGTSTSTQMSIVNGAVSNNVLYSYRLQPYQAGTITIDPVKLTLNGQTFFTDPIEIQVTQGTGRTQAPSQSQRDFKAPSMLGDNDLFVEAVVDNPEPYVGEQINYKFRYYEALDAMRLPSIFGSQPDYQPPALTGFWAEGDIDVTSYRVSANGRIYTVTELTQVLFPTASGEESIESARITIPGGGFRNDVVLDTDPVTVNVRQLPAGAPESFTGAVGQFDIQSTLDANRTRVDEPVTLQVTLSGQGNISTASDPIWPEMEGWRVFESDSTVSTQVENGFVTGSRTYDRLMVPTVAGTFTVPPVEYSFFDPIAGEYRTIATDPMAMAVTPGAVPAPAPAAAAPPAENVTPLTADDVDPAAVASLKPVPERLEMVDEPLTAQPWYWLLWGAPLMALTGGFVWQRRQTHLEQNAAAVRSSRALKTARKSIARARNEGGSESRRYVTANSIMTAYLSAKLDKPVAGKTNDAITDALVEQGMDPETDRGLITRSLACLDSYEHNRYSPDGVTFATPDQLLDEIASVVGELDGKL